MIIKTQESTYDLHWIYRNGYRRLQVQVDFGEGEGARRATMIVELKPIDDGRYGFFYPTWKKEEINILPDVTVLLIRVIPPSGS